MSNTEIVQECTQQWKKVQVYQIELPVDKSVKNLLFISCTRTFVSSLSLDFNISFPSFGLKKKKKKILSASLYQLKIGSELIQQCWSSGYLLDEIFGYSQIALQRHFKDILSCKLQLFGMCRINLFTSNQLYIYIICFFKLFYYTAVLTWTKTKKVNVKFYFIF